MAGEFKMRKELEAEHANAWEALREFQDGLKLEPDARGSSPHVFDCKSYPHLPPGPPTVDDLVERRIAQAERVVALYRLWSDTLWPRDLVGIVPEEPADEAPTFQEWLEQITAELFKGLKVPAELLEASEPPSWSASREWWKAREKAEQAYQDPVQAEQDAQEDEGAAIDREIQEEGKTPGVSPPGYWSKALRLDGISETHGFHWWPKGAAGQSSCRFHTTPVGQESDFPSDPEQRCNHCIECWRAAGGVDSE